MKRYWLASLALACAVPGSAATLVFRNTSPGVQYVGSRACAACHKPIYDKYVRTAMGRSSRIARAGPWNEPAHIHSDVLGRDFRVFSKDGELYQSESEERNGATVFNAAHKLEYAIGSGENGVSFVVRRAAYLFQAPLSYYSKARKWDLSPGFEKADEGFSRPIYEACIVCHAGRPQAAPGRDGMYRDPPFAEMAIGCENCHGPGLLHVQERSRGARGVPDTSIVNPARLPARLAEDICMKCHQAGDARVLLPGKRYPDFRPGTPLLRTVAIIGLPVQDTSADLLQHHTAMKLSQCYRATNGRLSCLTCHDPHTQPDAAAAPAYFRAKCLTCHTSQSCRLDSGARGRTTPADNCVACHMPKRTVEKISHSALTNHRIPTRPGDGTKKPARPAVESDLPGLELINAQPGETALPLVTCLAAYGELMDREPSLRAQYFALLEQARRELPSDPLVLAALGRKALAEHSPEAIDFLTKAEQNGTPAASTYIDLSEALVEAGRFSDSIRTLERGAQAFPYSKSIRKHLILAYIRDKAYTRAKSALEAYVEDFPEDSFMRGLLSRATMAPSGPGVQQH
jgi:hypothetical protein